MREKELDLFLAEKLKSSEEFRRWLLGRTPFAAIAHDCRLLHSEQATARKKPNDPKFWYRHWWCRLPDGTESETDILALFQTSQDRIALHIENKPPRGRLREDQEIHYAVRAEFMATRLPITYSRWATVLLAPRSFMTLNAKRCECFDSLVAYEDIEGFVPEFGNALRNDRNR